MTCIYCSAPWLLLRAGRDVALYTQGRYVKSIGKFSLAQTCPTNSIMFWIVASMNGHNLLGPLQIKGLRRFSNTAVYNTD